MSLPMPSFTKPHHMAAIITALFLGTLPTTKAFSAGVPITPGLWEIKTENAMLGTEDVDQQCMMDSVFDPVSLLGEEEGCEINNETVTGKTVAYDLACTDDEARGQAIGHFSFTIDGDQGNGDVDLTFDIGGQQMSMQFSMDAKRVGDC